jgi:hypothetical protein
MDAANVYAVMNVISAAWTFIVVAATELSTIQATWDHTVKVIIRSHSVDLEIHGWGLRVEGLRFEGWIIAEAG